MIKKPTAITAALIVSSMSVPSFAQVPEKRESFELDEIVVTANRREESLQDVAMSVSAFDEQFFDDSGIKGLTDLQQFTPSLSVTTASESRTTAIRIRGIGSQGSNSGIDPSVGVFIDGVYQGRAGMSLGDLIDIDHVEVLRGPQGALYGKNTAAGAISVLTKKPSMKHKRIKDTL